MSAERAAALRAVPTSEAMAALGRQYGCGPIELTGTADAFYERHLLFDNVENRSLSECRRLRNGMTPS